MTTWPPTHFLPPSSRGRRKGRASRTCRTVEGEGDGDLLSPCSRIHGGEKTTTLEEEYRYIIVLKREGGKLGENTFPSLPHVGIARRRKRKGRAAVS